MSRPTVAFYSPTFLTASMTFVYRQLQGISGRYEPFVLTGKREHPELFPFSPVYEAPAPRPDLASRVRSKLTRVVKRQYSYTSAEQFDVWLRACRTHRPALIHAHFGYGGLQMLPLAEALSIPLLVTFHGNDASSFLRDAVYAANVKELMKHAHVICVSEMMRNRLLSLGPAIHMLPPHYYGVPVADFPLHDRKPPFMKKNTGEHLKFLQIANLVEKKGHQYTLQAFGRFVNSYRNASLTLGGSGELRGELEKLAGTLGISDKVHFVGRVAHTDVVPLMREADIFLHHSVTGADGSQEGIPNVIMEAMCTGLPVISTCHAGIPELIEHGQDGYLVNERDVEAYAASMSEAVETEKTIGLNAHRKIVTSFNLDEQNKRLGDVYAEIIF